MILAAPPDPIKDASSGKPSWVLPTSPVLLSVPDSPVPTHLTEEMASSGCVSSLLSVSMEGSPGPLWPTGYDVSAMSDSHRRLPCYGPAAPPRVTWRAVGTSPVRRHPATGGLSHSTGSLQGGPLGTRVVSE